MGPITALAFVQVIDLLVLLDGLQAVIVELSQAVEERWPARPTGELLCTRLSAARIKTIALGKSATVAEGGSVEILVYPVGSSPQ